MNGSFRLLDGCTGWSAASSENITGLDDPAGISLAAAVPLAGAISADALAGCLPPARTARTPSGLLVAGRTGLRVADLRRGTLDPVTDAGGRSCAVRRPRALSWNRDLLLATYPAARAIDGLRLTGSGKVTGLRPIFRIDVPAEYGRPRLATLTPWSMIAVITRKPPGVLLIGLDGVVRAHRLLTGAGWCSELGVVATTDAPGAALVASLHAAPGWRRLLRLSPAGLGAEPLDPALLCIPDRQPPLRLAADGSWSVQAGPARLTFTADGDPATSDPPAPAPRFAAGGVLTTTPLDSGIEDCRWHRIRVEADEPAGTALQVEVATLTAPGQPPRWTPLPDGGSLAAGPHDALIAAPPRDGLNPQPPGRWLMLRLRLHGDGSSTPVVRRVRADFEVPGTLSMLPAVHQAPDEAGTFVPRFVSLFDATLDEIDDAIGRAPLRLDPGTVDGPALGSLAAALGLHPDPGWPADRLRALLVAWPRIWPRLGTPDGLTSLIDVLFGVRVLVDEVGRRRPWGAVGSARLGAVRLFSTAQASLRLGTGQLGSARLNRPAGPLAPAYRSGAFVCVVHAPAGLGDDIRRSLEAVVREFVPAHVVAEVRYAPATFVTGLAVAVQVGTRLSRLTPGVLSTTGGLSQVVPRIVLGRSSPLPRRTPGGVPVTVGRRPAVGITTRVR